MAGPRPASLPRTISARPLTFIDPERLVDCRRSELLAVRPTTSWHRPPLGPPPCPLTLVDPERLVDCGRSELLAV